MLQRVNRIRTDHGADPAFADLGVLVVDYGRAYGQSVEFKHGLGGFICDFDAGRYPELLTGR